MMKKMKKSLALMMVVMMMASMTVMTVFGADNAKIQIDTVEGVSLADVTFTAYLISSGKWNDDGSMSYADMDADYLEVIWTEYLVGNNPLTALIPTLNTTTSMTAWMAGSEDYGIVITDDQVDKILAAWALAPQGAGVTGTYNSTSGNHTISGLVDGYYMVLSKDFPPMMVHTEEDETKKITIKADYPTMKKWIQHNDVSETVPGVPGVSEGWGIVGDNQIGDTVYFKLKITLPANLTGYDSYVYVLADAMDSSLEFNKNSVKFYSDSDEDTEGATALYTEGGSGEALTDYISALYQDEDGFVYGIDVKELYDTLGDLTAEDDGYVAGTKYYSDYITMYVYYNAELTSAALAYEDNQVNSAALIYSKSSNDQNQNNDTILKDLESTFADYDGFDDIIDKNHDGTSSDQLEAEIQDILETDEYGSLGTTGNPVFDYTFYVDLEKVDGGGDTTSGAEFQLLDADGDAIFVIPNDDNTVFSIATADTDLGAEDTFLMGDGIIRIIGLDDAVVYGLKEVAAPNGLIKAEQDTFYFILDVAFDAYDGELINHVTSVSITEWDIVEEEKATTKTDHIYWGASTNDNASDVMSNSDIKVIVVNTSGSLLPTTGGMGTVIFQVVGAGMVLAAGTLLMMKKKQS